MADNGIHPRKSQSDSSSAQKCAPPEVIRLIFNPCHCGASLVGEVLLEPNPVFIRKLLVKKNIALHDGVNDTFDSKARRFNLLQNFFDGLAIRE